MRITVILACFICTSMLGQDLKKKKKTEHVYQEIFTIDKKTKEKQGNYVKINNFSKDTLVKGTYEQGKKAGVWSFMDNKNSVYFTYDFDQNKVAENYGNFSYHDSIQVKIGNQFKLTRVGNPAIYLGYRHGIPDVLSKELKPPKSFFSAAKPGMVVVSLEINQKGEMENLKFESSNNDKLHATIENSIKKLTNGWIPASIDGVPVVSKMYIAFNFDFNLLTDPEELKNSKYDDRYKLVDKPDLKVVRMTFMSVVRQR